MSDAKSCDRCGELYEVKKGTVVLDVKIATGSAYAPWDGWNEVDFCAKCGQRVLEAIGPAIIRTKKKRK